MIVILPLTKRWYFRMDMVVHISNPSYEGGQENCDSRLTQAKMRTPI
jgi:hypothetical protein